MAITTKLAVENYLLTIIDSNFDAQIEEWIGSVEAYMNKQTDRQLIADSTAADYYYDVPTCSAGKLRIDEFVDIVSITDVDSSTALDLDDVFFYPLNADYINRIEYDAGFTWGRKKIKINGKRGRFTAADLPADLKFAATVLVAGIVNFSNQSSGEIKSETAGRYSVTYTTDSQKMDYARVNDIIRSYRKMR